MDYPDLKRAVFEQVNDFSASTILIEDKASGTQLIQELIRDGMYGVTPYAPTMDKIMRLHSVTNTIANGFVYVPATAPWLETYVHELTTFPASKHDDQADSTSQALDWFKQHTQTYGLWEYCRRQELAQKLGLPSGYRFTQCEEDEEILAAHESTGIKIRWNGQSWVAVASSDMTPPKESCDKCGAHCIAEYGDLKHCHQCPHEWPNLLRIQRGHTQTDVAYGSFPARPARIIFWR